MPLEVTYDRHHLTISRYVRNPRRAIASCSCGWRFDGLTRDAYNAAAEHDGKLPIPEATNAQAHN